MDLVVVVMVTAVCRMTWLWRLLHRRELSGDGVCPPYLVTYRLLSTRWGGIFVHHFLADDWSLDLHDHPYRMISIGVKGSYDEELPGGIVTWKAPWVRMFAASHAHRIRLPKGECWTVVISLRGSRPWGFYVEGRWVAAADYMKGQPRRTC